MKSLNIDIIFPWEIGVVIVVLGLIMIIIGVRQSIKDIDNFEKILLIKPTTKIFFGSVFCIFGLIQMLPLIRDMWHMF